MTVVRTDTDRPGDRLSRASRKKVLDRIVTSTITVVFGIVTVLWMSGGTLLSIRTASIVVLVYVPLYLATSEVASRFRSQTAFALATVAQMASVVLVLAVLWHFAGGLRNPAFLIAFVPVSLAIAVLYRWKSSLVASVGAVIVIFIVAFGESSELRWHLVRLGVPVSALAISAPVVRPPDVSPGLITTAASDLFLLGVFGLVTFSVGGIGEGLNRFFQSQHDRHVENKALRQQSDSVLRGALLAAIDPTALVDARTGELLVLSRSFEKQMLVGDRASRGTIFEAVQFANRAEVEALVGGAGGRIPFCAYSVDSEARVAEVTVTKAQSGQAHVACVTIRDQTELTALNQVLDDIDEVHVVLGGDGRLRYANRAARSLFGNCYAGAQPGDVLVGSDLPENWWQEPARHSPRRALQGSDFLVEYCHADRNTAGLRLVRLRRPI